MVLTVVISATILVWALDTVLSRCAKSNTKIDKRSKQYVRITRARWYVVHTYSGHENKVKATIEKAVKTRGMEDYITQVVVPTEDVVETTKTGKRKN